MPRERRSKYANDAALASKMAQKANKKDLSMFGYNLNEGLFNYRVALANSQNQVVRINCIGDSITRGEYSSTEYTKSWVAQLRSSLQADYVGTGEGFINVYEAKLPTGAKPRWTISGTWINNELGGFGGHCARSGTTDVTTASVTFTGPTVTLLYSRASDGGDATIQIDGVTKGAINCKNTIPDFTQAFTVTGLGEGNHTLTVIPQGNGRAFIEGIIEGGGATSGIQVNRIGVSGWKASNWINTNNYARWGSMPPHLTVIALGMNEAMSDNTPVSTYKANLATLIDTFQSFGSSVVLVAYFAPSPSWTSNWINYVNAMYELADTYNIGLIDMYQAWGKSYSKSQSLGLFGVNPNDYSGVSGTNLAHPGDKGYNYIAQIIKPHLTI